MVAYTHRAHHKTAFLASYLLPISEVLSFDECVAYLNQAVTARLAQALRDGAGFSRPYPTLDDFDFVKGVAEERRMVLAGVRAQENTWWMAKDRFGMLRDRDDRDIVVGMWS
jgi:hypothetical protein